MENTASCTVNKETDYIPGSTNPGCTNPLKCKLGRSVRDTKAMAPQPIMNELESKFNPGSP